MEIWDVYDIDRNKTGQTIQRGEKLPEEILELIDQGKFVPYFKGYISTIFATSHHLGTIQEKQ